MRLSTPTPTLAGPPDTSRNQMLLRNHITPATLDELHRIVVAMLDKWRAAVLLGAWCALRYGEVAELRRKEIDLEVGLVHVQRGVLGGR